MSRQLATAVLVLWRSRQFCTADIADLLGVAEADVSRLITAARSVALELTPPGSPGSSAA